MHEGAVPPQVFALTYPIVARMVMLMSPLRWLVSCVLAPSVLAIAQATPSNPLAPYISVAEPVVALTHVEIIDGTGTPPTADQTLVIDHGTSRRWGRAAACRFLPERRFSIFMVTCVSRPGGHA